MFSNREDAARRLARRLRDREMIRPIVLAIPRGGVAIGAILADQLHADLDVVLSRKLGAPDNPELALGAIGEDDSVYLNPEFRDWFGEALEPHLKREIARQKAVIAQRKKDFREGRPPQCLEGRTVVLTDDGIATGATMKAALHVLQGQKPAEVIIAVPVASPDRLEQMRPLCQEIVCLLAPEDLSAVGQYYADFRQAEDHEVVSLLRAFRRDHSRPAAAVEA